MSRSVAILKESKFHIGVDHEYSVINKQKVLKGKAGLVKHLAHSMLATGHFAVEYHEDVIWTPFGTEPAWVMSSVAEKKALRRVNI
jgi:hypothetical protein